ncbi:hypothetical protein ElyMa_006786200 [Elysia marginata]|uniref:Uncharacterized protein n=1 Tax=Elysia marginata TaxID=1093978 RepID=A0AAV4IZX6_9GAST|nr:hypothetical protein ElyMa_006786200 [Elysia marginata]
MRSSASEPPCRRAGCRSSGHRALSTGGSRGSGLFRSWRPAVRTSSFLEMATLVFVLAYLLVCVTVTSEKTKTQEEEDRGKTECLSCG